MENRDLEDIKKIINTKISMEISSGNIRVKDENALEFDLRKSGSFTQAELDLIFGKKSQEYYDMLERLRKIKIGLIDENEPIKNSDEELYKKSQDKKSKKELDDILKYADIK